MNNKGQSGFLGSLVFIFLLTLLLTGCPSSGSSTNNAGDNGSFDIGNYLPFRIVTLDHMTGTLPAGSRVPLACITGGSIIGGHGLNCEDPHLHDFISILDEGGPYPDPDSVNCGHGVLSFTSYNNLSYRCNLIDDASTSLQVVTNEYALFTVAMASFFLPGNTTDVPDAQVDITDRVNSEGVVPVENTSSTTYSRLQLYTACFRGFNPDTGENEYVHQKYFFDLPLTDKLYLKVDCTPYVNYNTANYDIGLSADYTGGEFLTGGRRTGSQLLTGNSNNALSFNVTPSETEKTGLVIGYGTSGWDAMTLKYNPQVAGSFDANPSTLEATQDVTVNDSLYAGDADFTGTKVYARASGLFQSYYELPPPAGTRPAPTIPSLGIQGGIHKFKVNFQTLEAVTNNEQSLGISKYQNSTSDVVFNETRSAYLQQSDITYDTPAFSGFKFGITYDPGITGQERVKTAVRSETLDTSTTPNIRHFWRGENYMTGTTETDMSFSDSQLSPSGAVGFAPTQSGNIRFRMIYSNMAETARRHDQFDDYPPSERDGEISLRVGYTQF